MHGTHHYRQAFFTKLQAEQGRKDWVKAVSQSVGSKSIYCPATDTQISSYMMKKVEEFYSSQEDGEYDVSSPKRAAVVTGLQPDPQQQGKIWVLNGQTHIDKDGLLLPPKNSPFIWLGDYSSEIPGIPPSTMACSVSSDLAPGSSLKALRKLIKCLKHVQQENFSASLFLLGSQVLCTHYGGIMDCPVGGQVPATIAFGEVGLGKSQCAEAAQSMLGLPSRYRPSKITDAQATKFATQTTLGFVIDDPSDASEIAEKYLIYFEKGMRASSASTIEPKCTFITTMNMNCLESLARMPKRYII